VARTLADLPRGRAGILLEVRVSADVAACLMELGFLPGARVVALHNPPGGDPRVFRVDGGTVAPALRPPGT
jgi:Fe2+ transport system protein FeoA